VELFHRAGLPASEAGALTLLAHTAAVAGRSDEAEAYALDAVARAEAGGSPDAIAEARAALGQIASDNDHLELAADALRSGIVALHPLVSGQLAEARAQLAARRGEVADAERHLRAALEAYQQGGAQRDVAKVSLEMGALGRRTRNWTLALIGFEAADRLGDTRQRASAALGLAELSVDRGDRTAATADQLAVAIQMLLVADDATLADVARLRRGAVLLTLGRDLEVRAELEAALAGFEARGQAERAARVRDLLAGLEDRSGRGTSG
jgi:tetratricopeptide (TPR) repeat protein